MFYYNETKQYATQLEAAAFCPDCNFYYHDITFSNTNWTIEPPVSLSELYKQRAQQIRDENQYIILCYSGGYDSSNILHTFYKNNIHIDEILVVGAFSQDHQFGSDANHNGEIYENVIPTLNTLNLKYTKITFFDYTKLFTDISQLPTIAQYGNEWPLYLGAWRSVHHLFWRDLKKFIGRNNNKQTAYIMGSDKINVHFIENKPCVRILDLTVNDYGGAYTDENFKRINFYTSPDPISIEIMKKQAHTVLNIIKSNDNNIPVVIKNEAGFSRVELDHLKVGVQEVNLNMVLYPDSLYPKYMSRKSKVSQLSVRDTYLLHKKDSEIYKMYSEGLKVIERYIALDQKPKFWTKPYWLS
jgi:hypothetical protein